MEELDFSRPENDGRNRCTSQLPWVFPNGKHPTCELEKYHPLDHGGDGFIWSDDEAMLVVDRHNLWYKALWAMILINAAYVVYAVVELILDRQDVPPLWYQITSPLVFVLLMITVVGYGRRKFKKERRRLYVEEQD